MSDQIPDKIYFKIGEVAEIVGVKPHVLRYWESEFDTLTPVKSRSNQRLYRREDIEQALQIKTLLYQQGFTVPGARKALGKGRRKVAVADPLDEIVQQVVRLRDRLQARINEEHE